MKRERERYGAKTRASKGFNHKYNMYKPVESPGYSDGERESGREKQQSVKIK